MVACGWDASCVASLLGRLGEQRSFTNACAARLPWAYLPPAAGLQGQLEARSGDIAQLRHAMAAEVSEAAQQVQLLLAAQGRVSVLECELAAATAERQSEVGVINSRGDWQLMQGQACFLAPLGCSQAAAAADVPCLAVLPPPSGPPCSTRSCR